MVHALSEIQRVLTAQGVLIDLRPFDDHWPIEVVSQQSVQETGRVIDIQKGLEDDAAADRSIAKAVSDGWFTLEHTSFFPFYYYWDSPREMELYVDEEWQDFNVIDEQTRGVTRSIWAAAGADARPRVRLKMLITRLKKK